MDALFEEEKKKAYGSNSAENDQISQRVDAVKAKIAVSYNYPFSRRTQSFDLFYLAILNLAMDDLFLV